MSHYLISFVQCLESFNLPCSSSTDILTVYGVSLMKLLLITVLILEMFEICTRPNTGVSSFEEDRTDLMVKYAPISTEDAGE